MITSEQKAMTVGRVVLLLKNQSTIIKDEEVDAIITCMYLSTDIYALQGREI